jgi:hypothetical protein
MVAFCGATLQESENRLKNTVVECGGVVNFSSREKLPADLIYIMGLSQENFDYIRF